MAGLQDIVKWVFEVEDIVSGPVKNSVLALVGLDKHLHQSTKSLSEFERAFHTLNVAMAAGKAFWGAAASGVSAFGTALSAGANLLVSAANYAKDALISAGEMALHGFSYREDTVQGMTIMFQEMTDNEKEAAETANAMFDHALNTAMRTKFRTHEVIDMYKDLLTGGFSTGEVDTVVAAIADVSTARNFGKGQQVLRNLVKMQEIGRTTWGLFQAAGVAGGGVALKEIAPKLGINPDLPKEQLSKLVRKAMLPGGPGVSASVGIRAILEKIKNRYDPGASGILGGFAEAHSSTLSGIYSNFADMIPKLFMSKKFQETGGIATLKTSMRTIVDQLNFLDPKNTGAQRLLDVLGKITTDILGLFDISPNTAASAFDKVLTVAEKIEQVIHKITDWLKDVLLPGLGKMLTTEGGVSAAFKNALVSLGKWIGAGVYNGMKWAALGGLDQEEEDAKALQAIEDRKKQQEQNDADTKKGQTDAALADLQQRGGGFQWGLSPGAEGGTNAGNGLTEGLGQGLSTSLDAHSPSRVTESIGREMGRNAGEGLAIGLANGLRGGGGAGITIIAQAGSFQITIPGGSLDMVQSFQSQLYQSLTGMSRTPGAGGRP